MNWQIRHFAEMALVAGQRLDLRDDVANVTGNGFRCAWRLLRLLGAIAAGLQFDNTNRRKNDFSYAVLLLKPVQQHNNRAMEVRKHRDPSPPTFSNGTAPVSTRGFDLHQNGARFLSLFIDSDSRFDVVKPLSRLVALASHPGLSHNASGRMKA